jgi:hypothetical protein
VEVKKLFLIIFAILLAGLVLIGLLGLIDTVSLSPMPAFLLRR